MAKAEITVHIADLPTVKALLAELMAIGRALKDEEPFPRTEIGDAIHNLRGRAETAERALAALRANRGPDTWDHRPLGGGYCVCGRPVHTEEHRYDPETQRCTCGALGHPEWGAPA